MKKLLSILLTLVLLALPMALAEESSSIVVMQGSDSQGIIWTVALNTENQMGCVSLTPADADTTYITGPLAFGDGSFTITDNEDGKDYVFGYQDISATETILTYEPTGSEVQLCVVDQSVLSDTPAEEYYAGIDTNGAQCTMGINWESGEMALAELSTDGTTQVISGTFEAQEDGSLLFTTTDGNSISLFIAKVEDAPNQIDVTVNDATMRMSLVNTAVLGE